MVRCGLCGLVCSSMIRDLLALALKSRPGSRPRLMRIGLWVYGDDGTEYWLAAAWSAEGGR
jgi:hypothetical protein